MDFLRVEDDYRQAWDTFVGTTAPDGGLLHSWGWGDFQKALGKKVIRLVGQDGTGRIRAAALLIKNELPFEYHYWYCPRGPVAGQLTDNEWSRLFAEIKSIGREEKSFLVRLDPAWLVGNQRVLVENNFRKAEAEIQSKCSFVVDLAQGTEALLAGMKEKTRYNISLSQRRGVTVMPSTEQSDIEYFWQLTKQTAKRDGFVSHAKEHYIKLFEALSTAGSGELLLARYEDKIVGAGLIGYSGEVATYLHGASSNLYRNVMAPYALQWRAIERAIERGMKWYDLGGVNGTTFTDRRWEGITRFKTGFAAEGAPREYVGCYEYVVNPVIFAVYSFIKQIRSSR